MNDIQSYSELSKKISDYEFACQEFENLQLMIRYKKGILDEDIRYNLETYMYQIKQIEQYDIEKKITDITSMTLKKLIDKNR